MVKIRKEGITKFVPERELQRYQDLGFEIVIQTKPEPMVIEEVEEKPKKTKKAE